MRSPARGLVFGLCWSVVAWAVIALVVIAVVVWL